MIYECSECGFYVAGSAGDDEAYEDLIDEQIEAHEQLHRVGAALIVTIGHEGWCDCRRCCDRRAEPVPVPRWSSQAGLAAFRAITNR